jgi:elongation factor P hydroxylase
MLLHRPADSMTARETWRSCEDEPVFVRFDASVKFRICITPQGRTRSGLEEIGHRLASY